jgi:two-component sensor histidine kinase
LVIVNIVCNYIRLVRCLSLAFCLAIAFCSSHGQVEVSSWLQQLKNIIAQSAQFDAGKIETINKIKQNADRYSDRRKLFDHYLELYNEYAVFNFDSAYHYARQLKQTAYELNDQSLIARAGIKLNYVLLSAGMFKEVFDSLDFIDPDGLDSVRTAEYYVLKSRTYFDLADYNNDNIFSVSYNKLGEKFLDSSLLFLPAGSFEFYYYNGLKHIRTGQIWKAQSCFHMLAADPTLSLRSQAIVNSTLSDIYIRRGMKDSVIILLAKAAMADIQSSTKETTAIIHLATMLSNAGDLDNASLFIKKATDDAKTYGARQRMMQLSSVLPVIEAKKVTALKQQKSNVTWYAIIITVLLIFLLILAIVIMTQVKRLKGQQKAINETNISLHHLVDEKEWLIKEIHHRVKNNLHTISSLLESQSVYLRDEALEAIRDTQHRVFAMSLIHQKLYQPEKNVTEINMATYLHELVDYLRGSFDTSHRIQVKMDMEPVGLDISLAMPLGMIMNEAIINAVKYAFPGQKEGIVTIAIKKTGEEKFLFFVADNGTGLPDGFDPVKTNTLGMKLMKGLSEDIAANFIIESKHGTRITVEFSNNKSLHYVQNFGSPA